MSCRERKRKREREKRVPLEAIDLYEWTIHCKVEQCTVLASINPLTLVILTSEIKKLYALPEDWSNIII